MQTFRMQISIAPYVHFSGIGIDNRHGQLFTAGFHDSNMQRYALPYVTHHPALSSTGQEKIKNSTHVSIWIAIEYATSLIEAFA
jgi:hypothetical protein